MDQPQAWDSDAFGVLDLGAVRLKHMPDHKFRIQQHRADPHTQFASINSVRKTIYVIAGSLTVASEDGSGVSTVQASHFIDMPPGRYLITYPERVEWILVLELPPQVWQKG
jgi:hypothetical protein